MLVSHEDGGSAMPRLSLFRRQLLRLLQYVLLPLTLFYILVIYEPVPLSRLSHPRRKIDYDAHPTYEYTSLYRQKADLAFEQALDKKLLSLEQDTISLLDEADDLEADAVIWQLTTPDVATALKEWTKQWKLNNRDWDYFLLTARPAELYGYFESIPEIDAMKETSQDIQNDLTRYMLLWYHGGFYADVETWNRISLLDCKPIYDYTAREQGHNVSLMIGVETDEPYISAKQLREWRWARGFGFGQASMWAPMRFDPILRKAIVRTISNSRTQGRSAHEGWIQSLKNHVLGGRSEEVSGRGMFTDLVLEVLSESLKEDHRMRDRDAGLEHRVTWKKFRAMRETAWMDVSQVKEGSEDNMRGLAVLPVNIWYSGQNHSRSGSFEHPSACINYVPGFTPKHS
ncbi:hypothetical protein B2J93_4084 [Marssonina coronariae]|uniref:Glycosyltransferase family 32 protein n=1 Tax=Diplocarpon coronariae TaxID=2795749 RepID=A0A218ZAL4_9HELO|nr:hypothetical protein B2J93_4084 [Marssonina coronariae]